MPQRPLGSLHHRVQHAEAALSAAIGDDRFLSHLALHEIETWVLADCARLGEFMGDSAGAARLRRLVDQAGGPEFYVVRYARAAPVSRGYGRVACQPGAPCRPDSLCS